jgi:serine/threonine protein kinase
MPDEQQDMVGKEILIDEMQFILTFLLDQTRAGKRMRLSDARTRLTGRLTLDFADYFKFLKRYNYVVINRTDHGLAVTEEGRSLTDEIEAGSFIQELKQHFGDQMDSTQELNNMEDDSFTLTRNEPKEEAEMTEEPEVEPAPKKRSKKASAKNSDGGAKGIKFDSKYTRYETIGSGGIGTVFRGRLSSLALDVAIKEIKELFSYFNFLQRSEVIRHLRDVVGQMAMLQHPLIVKIIDQNTDVAHPYFVSEFLPGGHLKAKLAGGGLPIERSLTLFTQLCYGLRVAHRAQVIHGNLKPENVLFDTQDNVRLTDFGMARLLQTDSDRTVPRVVTGSLAYLSPEQMGDAGTATVESDVYSLGIMLYEMLTGHLPGRRSPLPSEANKDVPQAIDDLFDRMTRDDPSERFPDMDALLDAFYKSIKDDRYLSKGTMIMFDDTALADDAAKTADAGESKSEKKDSSKSKKKLKN